MFVSYIEIDFFLKIWYKDVLYIFIVVVIYIVVVVISCLLGLWGLFKIFKFLVSFWCKILDVFEDF